MQKYKIHSNQLCYLCHMGNSFGKIFRVTTFGESHGRAIGGIIDGCPAGLKIDFQEVQSQLDRRSPGKSKITSNRKESDIVKFLSGVFEGITTGTPIGFLINNEDVDSKDYTNIKDVFVLLMRIDKRPHPGLRLAVDDLPVHASDAVSVVALSPGVGPAHTDEVALVPRTLTVATLRRPDRVVAALPPHRHQITGADLAQTPVLFLVAVGLRLDFAEERRLVQLPKPIGAMH